MISFARVGQDIQLDRIPLSEVELVRDMEQDTKDQSPRRKSSIPRKPALVSSTGIFAHSTHVLGEGSSSHSVSEKNQIQKSGSGTRERRRSQALMQSSDDSTFEQLSASFKNEVLSATVEGHNYINTLQVITIPDGFNSGRTYYLRAPTESMCQSIASQLRVVVVIARKRAQARTQLMKMQRRVRRFYSSLFFQGLIGMFIALVFSSI